MFMPFAHGKSGDNVAGSEDVSGIHKTEGMGRIDRVEGQLRQTGFCDTGAVPVGAYLVPSDPEEINPSSLVVEHSGSRIHDVRMVCPQHAGV